MQDFLGGPGMARDFWKQDMLLRWNDTSEVLGPWEDGIESRAHPGFEGAMSLGDGNPTLQPLADWLSSDFGYKQDVDMVAQPYDWRAGPGKNFSLTTAIPRKTRFVRECVCVCVRLPVLKATNSMFPFLFSTC